MIDPYRVSPQKVESIVAKALNEMESAVGLQIRPDVRSELSKLLKGMLGKLELRGSYLSSPALEKVIAHNEGMKQTRPVGARKGHVLRQAEAR